jgi:hypothetical protein
LEGACLSMFELVGQFCLSGACLAKASEIQAQRSILTTVAVFGDALFTCSYSLRYHCLWRKERIVCTNSSEYNLSTSLKRTASHSNTFKRRF